MPKKSYEIIKNVPSPEPKTMEHYEQVKKKNRVGNYVNADGRLLQFGHNDLMEVHDSGVAREIQQSQGQDGTGDVIVIEVDENTTQKGIRIMDGHRYHFGRLGKMPWKCHEYFCNNDRVDAQYCTEHIKEQEDESDRDAGERRQD